MKTEKVRQIWDDLYNYGCSSNKDDSLIIITEWANGEGYDISLPNKTPISLSCGELEAINYLVKSLDLHRDI